MVSRLAFSKIVATSPVDRDRSILEKEEFENHFAIMLSCPWQNFTPDNLYFCETEVCGWIRQPANAWSSLVILLAGLLIVYLTLIRRQNYLSLFGWILIFLGIGTFLYHATGALWGGILDLMGMFLLIFYLLVTSLWRIYHADRKKLLLIFVFGSSLMTGLHAIKPNLGTPFFALIAMITFYLETVVWRKERAIRGKLYFGIFAALILSALGIWCLDVTRAVCEPDNHFLQGHAIWHSLSGGAFFFLYLYLSKAKLPSWKLL